MSAPRSTDSAVLMDFEMEAIRQEEQDKSRRYTDTTHARILAAMALQSYRFTEADFAGWLQGMVSGLDAPDRSQAVAAEALPFWRQGKETLDRLGPDKRRTLRGLWKLSGAVREAERQLERARNALQVAQRNACALQEGLSWDERYLLDLDFPREP